MFDQEQRIQNYHHGGFTLIELSIVLVIIGLIVGGILTGQDLISAAAQRAQISQIEKYNTAAHTFQIKYGYLPGDIPDPAASQFGFQARGCAGSLVRGSGDGSGFLEGLYDPGSGWHCGICEQAGELSVFWVDLSTAGLVDAGLSTAQICSVSGGWGTLLTKISSYLPAAEIGQGNYVYAYSGGWNYGGNNGYGDNNNYYGISAVTGLGAAAGVSSTPGLSVIQAYNIDKKIDDSFPQSGRVIAIYVNDGVIWAGSGQPSGTAPYTSVTAGSATSCFDNGSTVGATQKYSMEINSGMGLNCALSFVFQ